jgi:hypothetical protein
MKVGGRAKEVRQKETQKPSQGQAREWTSQPGSKEKVVMQKHAGRQRGAESQAADGSHQMRPEN